MTTATDMTTITSLLDAADQLLEQQQLDPANSKYRNARDLAEVATQQPDLDAALKRQYEALLNRAVNGISTINQRRQAGTGDLKTTRLNPEEPKTQADRFREQIKDALTPERKLLVAFMLSGEKDATAEDKAEYQKLYRELTQSWFSQAQEAERNGNRNLADSLRSCNRLRDVAGPTLEREAVAALIQRIQTDWPAPIPAPTPVATSAAGSEPPIISSTAASAQRAEQLVGEAESYLRRSATTENYKQAISRLEQALGQGGLEPARRGQIEQRRAEVMQQYEQFRAQYQQLVTARQVQNIENELIAIRVLQIQGRETDDSGNSLLTSFAARLDQLRERLIRVAGEQATTADRLVRDGRDFLDSAAFHAAISRYQSVIALLRGEEIDERDEANNVKATKNSEVITAITSIRNFLTEHPDIQSAITTYTERLTAIERLPDLLERILPPYREAERLYNQRDYIAAKKQLDQIKSLLDDRLESKQIAFLEQQLQGAVEAQVSAQIQSLLDQAQIALSQDDITTVTNLIQQVRQIEPQFKSDKVDALRTQADAIITEIKTNEDKITAGLTTARSAFERGDLDAAERGVRMVLTKRSAHDQARKLLDSIIFKRVNTLLAKVDPLIQTGTRSQLEQVRPEVTQVRAQVAEMSDAIRREDMSETLDATLKQIDKRIKDLDQRAEQDRILAGYLQEFDRAYETNQFESAHNWLEQARQVAPSDVRIASNENKLKQAWRMHLYRRVNQFLDAEPPQPDAALHELATVEKYGLNDAKTSDLRTKAERLKSLSEARAAYERGEYGKVIDLLTKIEPQNEELLLLNTARHREAQRLAGLEDWAAVLLLLKAMDASQGEMPGLFKRATAEIALREAAEHLRAKRFDPCAAALDRVDQQQIAELRTRSAELRTKLHTAREIYQRIDLLVKAASDHKGHYENTRDRKHLLQAISTLDQALADPELAAGDLQREAIQQQRSEYQRIYDEEIRSERARLLASAEANLKADEIAEAISDFQAVHALNPSGNDPAAEDGIRRCRRRLAEIRVEVSTDVTTMLNLRAGGQRGIDPQQVATQIEKIGKIRQIEPDYVDRDLNTALSQLQEAAQFCQQADEALNTARLRWAELRRRSANGESIEGREVEQDIQRGIAIFTSRTYIHHELDRTNIKSLPTIFNKDLQELSDANRIRQELRNALEREPFQTSIIVSSFETLRRSEENLYQTTLALIDQHHVATVARPTSNAERYPRQHAIIRSLYERVESLKRAELNVPDLKALREIMTQRGQIEELIAQLDREKRFSA